MISISKKSKVKRKDIGTFDPYWPDPKDIDVIINDKNLIFTDINNFVRYIETFLKDIDITDTNGK